MFHLLSVIFHMNSLYGETKSILLQVITNITYFAAVCKLVLLFSDKHINRQGKKCDLCFNKNKKCSEKCTKHWTISLALLV